MEQIIVKHIDNTETIFPNRTFTAVVTKAEQRVSLLGENVLSIEINSAVIISFNIGDYVEVFGHTYYLNQLPSVKKINSRSFNYILAFESEQYELMDCAWLLPDDTTGDSFTGDLYDFLDILINDNITRSHDNWELGTYPTTTETKTLTFTDANCLSVLQQLCSEYNVEFEIVRDGENRVLNIKSKIGQEFPFSFEYGKQGGLYNINRNNNNNKNVVTRLYAYGSTDNIPSTYRNRRLCLPNCEKNQSYIEDEDDQAIFGHRENVKNFDDIKPERVGSVTSIDSNVLKFVDTQMFDLNETTSGGDTKWLIPGTSAKIEFTSGNLAGYSFDVNSYNHSSHTFTINSFTDENGLTFPNSDSSAFQIAVGDTYIITDIILPQTYIDDAESRLQTKAQEYYDEYCRPHVDYSIQIEPMYLKKLVNDNSELSGVTNIFNVGDAINIIDDDLNINESIRITSLTRNVINPYIYNLTLSNDVKFTTLQRIISDISNINQIVQINNLTDTARARRNWRTSQEVLNSVFDAEGDYYTEKIKPNSIETQYLAVGAKSQQFVLKNVNFSPNYGGNQNSIYVSGGYLNHFTISDTEIKSWTLSSNTVTGLTASNAYYIYAKCSKTGTTGQIIFDTTQRTFNSDSTYYYFLIGLLSSVISASGNSPTYRQISLTYGSTDINGNTIKTGRVESKNGSCYFDLDNNEIGGALKFVYNGSSQDVATVIGSVSNTANTASSNATTALTNASTAQSTANTALSNATDANNSVLLAQRYAEACNFLKAGTLLNSDIDFANGVNGIQVYNNSSNSNVILTRQYTGGSAYPNKSQYSLHICTAGSASPGLGGFKISNMSRANAVFVYRIICQIPNGYYIDFATNSTGTNTQRYWCTPQDGKGTTGGTFEEYIYIVKCGNSGNFSTTGYFYLSAKNGYSTTSVDWWVFQVEAYDCTAFNSLSQAFSNTTDIAGGVILSNIVELKNNNNNITAGISGMNPNTSGKNPRFWTGGSYSDAVNASNQSDSETPSSTLPILLLDNGYNSNIGEFKVLSNAFALMKKGQAIRFSSNEFVAEQNNYAPAIINNWSTYQDYWTVPTGETTRNVTIQLANIANRGNYTISINSFLFTTRMYYSIAYLYQVSNITVRFHIKLTLSVGNVSKTLFDNDTNTYTHASVGSSAITNMVGDVSNTSPGASINVDVQNTNTPVNLNISLELKAPIGYSSFYCVQYSNTRIDYPALSGTISQNKSVCLIAKNGLQIASSSSSTMSFDSKNSIFDLVANTAQVNGNELAFSNSYSQNLSSGYITCFKYGRVVFCKFNIPYSYLGSATIRQDYWCKMQIDGLAVTSSNNNTFRAFYITAGGIFYSNTLQSSEALYGTQTWIIP